MRITVVISSLGGGGAERAATTAVRHWLGRGHDVSVVTLATPDDDVYPVAPGAERISLDLIGRSSSTVDALRSNFRRLRALRAALRKTRPDAIVSFIDTMNVLALLATIGRRVPVVVTEVVNPPMHELPRGWSMLRRILYRRSAALVVPLEGLRSWGERFVRPDKIRVIPWPLGIGHATRPRKENSEHRRIVGMGRLVPQKGFDLLLRAFARCAPEHPDWELVIYGVGPERDALATLTATLRAEERVSFPGFAPDSAAEFAVADLFVLSSRFEGLPMVLLEAMACGLAVVAFDCPTGPGEVISNGTDGLLVPNGDVAALASAMSRLIHRPEERRRLGAAASRVRHLHDSERIMRSWDAVVEHLAHSRDAVAPRTRS